MKAKQKQIIMTSYEIFRKHDDSDYPELLVNLISAENVPEHERTRGEYLLGLWVIDYKEMTELQRLIYSKAFGVRLFGKLRKAYLSGRNVQTAICLLYELYYQKWPELAKYIKSGLESSDIQALKLLWNISFSNIQNIAQVDQPRFCKFLSATFEQSLRAYKWATFVERIYILQIVKHLTLYEPQKQFVQNWKQWVDTVKYMTEKEFTLEVQQHPEERVSLQYFKNGQKVEEVEKKEEKTKKKGEKANSSVVKQPLIEISPFVMVSKKEDERSYYLGAIRKEIIECRTFLWAVAEQFWTNEIVSFLSVLEEKLPTLRKDSDVDILYVHTLGSLLKFRKVEQIMREKIDEKIVVSLIDNMKRETSPFLAGPLSSIPQEIKQIYLSPQAGQTRESLLAKRIKSLIMKGNDGKDDPVNRCMLQICCQHKMIFQKFQLQEMIQFLINLRRKGHKCIEAYMIVVKVLAASLESPDATLINFMPAFKIMPEIVQAQVMNPQINELRKVVIDLFLGILTHIPIDEDNLYFVTIPLLKWLTIVQLNLPDIYIPMLKLLSLMICKFNKFMINQELSDLDKILSGICMKIGTNQNIKTIYACIECLILCFFQINFEASIDLYKDLNLPALECDTRIYQQQAQIIFKNREVKKFEPKKPLEKSKRASNALEYIEETDNHEERRLIYMNSIFGQKEKAWARSLLTELKEWENTKVIRLKVNLLENLLILTVRNLEGNSDSVQPNLFVQKLLLEMDADLVRLFQFLISNRYFQELFIFASKLYIFAHDYWFVSKLRSYQLLRAQVLQILSVYFNKNQVLYASSFFCGLLLPYANSPQLGEVYDDLNREQFISDLLKGSDEFVSLQKKYQPWFVVILMSFCLTEPIRELTSTTSNDFINLAKNTQWWQRDNMEISPQLIPEQDVEEMAEIIFQTSRINYTSALQQYYGTFARIICKTKRPS